MLKLSRETDYSLLAIMYIAAQPEGRLTDRRAIAAHYSIPPEFLGKVLQKLSRHGLVRSVRGKKGGYALAKRPEQITLTDVIEAVDGPVILVDCQCDARTCRQEEVCTVQGTLAGVRKQIRTILDGVSLHDMRLRLESEDKPRLISLSAASR